MLLRLSTAAPPAGHRKEVSQSQSQLRELNSHMVAGMSWPLGPLCLHPLHLQKPRLSQVTSDL